MTYKTWWYRERDAEVCRICEQDGIEAAAEQFGLSPRQIRTILKLYGVKAKKNVYRAGNVQVNNLVQALFEQAVRDSRRGDRDAHQWLARDAELWLKCLGLGVTRSMRERLVMMGGKR